MQNLSNVQIGRPISACLSTEISIDKWELLNALTVGAAHFGLSHQNLSVLRALLTFYPDREIPQAPRAAIVFPANKTLSQRLGGMPESTLRRHLAALVKGGIVSRHDSPNRKRFARRVGSTIKLSFGFDLSPLAQHASDIFACAESTKISESRRSALRTQILHQRAQLQSGGWEADSPLMNNTRLMLRRKASEQDLIDLSTTLQAEIDTLKSVENRMPSDTNTIKMIASNAQNERHIYSKEDNYTDSEETEQKKETQSEHIENLNLQHVLDQFNEYKKLFPDQIKNWNQLISLSHDLVPMMGIDHLNFLDAHKKMGAGQAAICVLYILEKFDKIKNPGGYLRQLANKARDGSFTILPIITQARNKNHYIAS